MTIARYSRVAAALLAAAVMVPAGSAWAEGEGNGPDYPGLHSPDVVVGEAVVGNVSQGYAGRGPVVGGLSFNDTLPPNSNGAGEPEPANSLPRGFENGMPGLRNQQAMQRYWSTHR